VRHASRIVVRTGVALLIALLVTATAAQFMPLQQTEIPGARENTTT
jgi:hypothetical protein